MGSGRNTGKGSSEPEEVTKKYIVEKLYSKGYEIVRVNAKEITLKKTGPA